jgi:hypothetical protein
MTLVITHIPEGQVNHVTTHPSVPAPPNGMLIRCLLSWTFDRVTVPPTFRPGPRIKPHGAARADASGLVNSGTASCPDERLSLHTAAATGSGLGYEGWTIATAKPVCGRQHQRPVWGTNRLLAAEFNPPVEGVG